VWRCIAGLPTSPPSYGNNENGNRSAHSNAPPPNNAHRPRPVGFVAWRWRYLLRHLFSVGDVLRRKLGCPGPDAMTAMRNPFFDFEVPGDIGAPRSRPMAVSLHLSRPEASVHGWGVVAAYFRPGLLVAGKIASEMMLPQAAAADDPPDRRQFADLHDGYSADCRFRLLGGRR